MKNTKELFENNYNVWTRYTDERNAQIVIALLKAHNIHKVVVSPGMTNVCFVASIQTDAFFELYSAPDERSAAYIACGISEESNEIVVLSCTGATASRNYYPGLTEAFYSKLPILAITSSRRLDRVGHNFDQVTDRTNPPRDVVKLSVQVPYIRDEEDVWACEIAVNKAILEVRRNGNGPVHINLETMYSPNMNYSTLPPARIINRFFLKDNLPKITGKRVAIVVGNHLQWSESFEKKVDLFCQKYNGVVFCDHTSNYRGMFRINPNLMSAQRNNNFEYRKADLIISIGNISSSEFGIEAKESWRVNLDGEIRDTFWNLTNVFEMEEEDFFEKYSTCNDSKSDIEYYSICAREMYKLFERLPNLPFSNVWIASETVKKIPDNSNVHLGIRNSLRSWNYFETDREIKFYANTGGFGIDGSLSSTLGNSLVSREICFCVLGDLSFFYDLNALGNRHVNPKLRILLINNGTGMEMQFTGFLADRVGAEKDSVIAATGHYGNKSKDLVKNIAENLGFMYLSAQSKEEYRKCLDIFCSSEVFELPILLEAFIEKEDENKAYIAITGMNGERKLHTEKKITPSKRLLPDDQFETVIFGTGTLFKANIVDIMKKKPVRYACDNDSSKWGKEVAPGIMCISPKDLQKLDNPIVIIAIVDAAVSFMVINQLLDMGIKRFDHITNWLRYEEGN